MRWQVQIATLMQLQGSRADPAQLERLQSMLSEKNGEIQNLMTKLQRLEKVEVRITLKTLFIKYLLCSVPIPLNSKYHNLTNDIQIPNLYCYS